MRNIKIKTSFYFFIYKILFKPKICLLIVENSACLRRNNTNKGKAKQKGLEIVGYSGVGVRGKEDIKYREMKKIIQVRGEKENNCLHFKM